MQLETDKPVTHHALTVHITTEELDSLLTQMDEAFSVGLAAGLRLGGEYADLYNLLAEYAEEI